MNTQQTIQEIKRIINLHGNFGVGDVEANSIPIVSSLGSSVLLAEQFNESGVEVCLYNGDDFSSKAPFATWVIIPVVSFDNFADI